MSYPTVTIAEDGSADYVSIQATLNALPTTGGKIFIKAGQYTLPSALLLSKSNVTIEGEGPATVLLFDGSTIATAIKMADTTQRTGIKLKSFQIKSTATGQGVALDASYMAISQFDELWIDQCNGGILLNSNTALYNKISNPRIGVSGAGSYGIKFDNGAQENTVFRPRIITTSQSTGVILNAHSNSLYDVDVETGAAIGVDIQASGHACTLFAPYLEGNVINLQLASGVEAPTVIGGTIASGTTNNIKNNGAKGINIYNIRLEFEQFTYTESLNGYPGQRWVLPFHGGGAIAATDQTATAGRVLLEEFEVKEAIFADGVAVSNGSSVAGNVTVGIYGPITTEETCAGAPVLVQSASTAVAGTSVSQFVSFTKTLLKPGRYYLAVEFDNAGNNYFRHGNGVQVTGWTQRYDRGGGYGALTDPCPTIVDTGSAFPGARVRCASLTTI